MSSGRFKKDSSKRQKAGNSKNASKASSPSRNADHEGALFYGGLFVAFFVVCLLAYSPALSGAFISDDEHYVLNNRFVHDLTFDNVLAILDPTGTPAKLVENYAPVHLLLNALTWQLFELETTGYHVVNIAFHALASVLLVLIFRVSTIARIPALLGGAFFLLHPANIEAVAWISQLKTPSALVLTLLALMLQRRLPLVAVALFALALFAKPTAAVGLFVLAVGTWQARSNEKRGRPKGVLRAQWGWVGAWALVLVAFAVAEFWAFNQTAGQAPVLYADTIVRLRTVCAVALRYLVMAVSSSGLSTFHEPPAAESWFDPWWLVSLAALGLLAFRTWLAIKTGRTEALYWIWAVVSFAPICGVIPLPFPMADRYLYFILPGLIGAVLLMSREHMGDVYASVSEYFSVSTTTRVVVGLTVVWIAFFATRVYARAPIWLNGSSMMADAEAHYRHGMAAQTRIAQRRAKAGDAEGTVRALRAARARGYNRVDHLFRDPGYNLVREDPLFVAFLNELATEWVERFESIEAPSQHEYLAMAQAYIALGDLDEAIRRIEAAVLIKGPITEELEDNLRNLQRERRFRDHRLKRQESDR